MSIKIIVMGVGGVGKSAITNRFVIGRWVEKYDPTIEESYQTSIDIDGKALQVEILDTAGQDEYTPLRETFMHTGDGFLLVYSITDDQTLEELRSIREQILRVHRDRKVPMVVVGNKVDMAASDRAVSKEEGKALADSFNAGFMEITVRIQSLICERRRTCLTHDSVQCAIYLVIFFRHSSFLLASLTSPLTSLSRHRFCLHRLRLRPRSRFFRQKRISR